MVRRKLKPQARSPRDDELELTLLRLLQSSDRERVLKSRGPRTLRSFEVEGWRPAVPTAGNRSVRESARSFHSSGKGSATRASPRSSA